MNNRFLIAISIVSHGDAGKIERLLISLQKHEPDAKRFQIILTDNLKDELPEYDPSPWGSLIILRNQKTLGFAENHNRAFQRAQGDYFCILNPDVVFDRPIFDRLSNRLQNDAVDIVAPLIMDSNGHVQDSFRTLPTPLELIHRRLPGYKFHSLPPDNNGLIRPDWIAAMFWLMSVEIYRKLGGMDERYRLYFEDVDFCTRARLQKLKIAVDTQAQVQHDAQRSSRKKIYYLLLHTLSALRFFVSSVYRQARAK